MPKRRILIALGLAALALALAGAGCGGDGGGTAEPAPPAEEPGAEPPADETTEAPGASTLELAAEVGGALAFDRTELSAPPGEVTIVLTNDSAIPHNVAIEDASGALVVEGEIFAGGGTRETTATLEAGTYTFFCSVPGHREAGMEGTLTVG